MVNRTELVDIEPGLLFYLSLGKTTCTVFRIIPNAGFNKNWGSLVLLLYRSEAKVIRSVMAESMTIPAMEGSRSACSREVMPIEHSTAHRTAP